MAVPALVSWPAYITWRAPAVAREMLQHASLLLVRCELTIYVVERLGAAIGRSTEEVHF